MDDLVKGGVVFEADEPLVGGFLLDALDVWEGFEEIEVLRKLRELDLDVVGDTEVLLQLGDGAREGHLAGTNDADAVGDVLYISQNMG